MRRRDFIKLAAAAAAGGAAQAAEETPTLPPLPKLQQRPLPQPCVTTFRTPAHETPQL